MKTRIDNYRHKGLRKHLVNEIREKGIQNEAVLKAIEKVPRHFFYDGAFMEQAYQDKAFPIGEGQTISQPYTVAYQSELLEIKKGDKILEIGTGSGYQTCILLELGAKVYTIERIRKLFADAKSTLNEMDYKAHFFCADGSKGMSAYAPYDKIIVTAGAPFVPETLLAQLKIGGILVIPVGDEKTQKMLRITKKEDGSCETIEFDTFRFVPLIGDKAW